MKKAKFKIGDSVTFVTKGDDEYGLVTALFIDKDSIQYRVVIGTSEKWCYDIELEKKNFD